MYLRNFDFWTKYEDVMTKQTQNIVSKSLNVSINKTFMQKTQKTNPVCIFDHMLYLCFIELSTHNMGGLRQTTESRYITKHCHTINKLTILCNAQRIGLIYFKQATWFGNETSSGIGRHPACRV